jgi:hypothetical protein
MKLLLDWVFHSGFLVEGLGVVGLGLLGLASARLAQRDGSWGGSLMAGGAVLLLIGRLWVLLSSSFLTAQVARDLGPQVMGALFYLPTVLMTAGLAGVVWGLWGHEKWLRESH